ncbi:hypothetical protein KAR91_46015 [Candidatus Pacearchaeota archaeon]|nr:hypothetical protein [Candidatus Pacearchaeota archaeon]
MKEYTIVAGVTRSGMTATMQMLNAGGYSCAGEYPDFEPFGIGCIPWPECVGKAVKVVDTHLQFPPKNGDYKIILLKRDIKQQAKSMIKFLKACGFNMNVNMKAMKKSIKDDYKKIENWSKNYKTLKVTFESIIDQPHITSLKITKFVGGEIDVSKMSDVIIKRSSDCVSELFELSMI